MGPSILNMDGVNLWRSHANMLNVEFYYYSVISHNYLVDSKKLLIS